jgi:hypothetical protein
MFGICAFDTRREGDWSQTNTSALFKDFVVNHLPYQGRAQNRWK